MGPVVMRVPIGTNCESCNRGLAGFLVFFMGAETFRVCEHCLPDERYVVDLAVPETVAAPA